MWSAQKLSIDAEPNIRIMIWESEINGV
jgi:hypothetical protein